VACARNTWVKMKSTRYTSCRARVTHVIAVTSPAKKQQRLDSGAKEVFFRDAKLIKVLVNNSVDVVIDLVSSSQCLQLLQVLKARGRYAVSGAIGGPLVELDIRALNLKDLSFFGCTVLEQGIFQNLLNCIASPCCLTFPLQEINTAQKVFLEKKHISKIVLTVAGAN
jgi:NADPH:quinone reductase-like Zn-dependent oxidoreductase